MQLWFQEEQDANQRLSYKIKDVLYKGQSPFQSVHVVTSEAYGNMLLIDGLVMITDLDEFVYHEMIAHVPALHHKAPENVVVIGGGDGGTVRELLKHPEIKKITLCEIDELVVNTSKEFFPKVACGLDDPRVDVKIADGIAYMKSLEEGSVDIVIVDSTDPIGPGEGLFTGEFYRSVSKALRDDGLMVCQSESPWYDEQILRKIQKNVSSGFDHVYPYIGAVPTYPRGFWSWTLATKKPGFDPACYDETRFKKIESNGLSYLTQPLMSAVFALPAFYKKTLGID